MIMDCISTI